MAGRRRGDRSSLGGADPLWSKAPLVLLPFPGLFVSIAVGALLLAVAASAYPLFMSASASELVKARIDDPSYTRWAVGITYRNGAMPLPGPGRNGDVEPRVDRLFESLVASSPYPGRPGRVGPREGRPGLGPRRVGEPRHAPVHRRGRALERRDRRGGRRGRRPGPRPGVRRPRDLHRRRDRGRLSRRRNGDASGRPDLPVPSFVWTLTYAFPDASAATTASIGPAAGVAEG